MASKKSPSSAASSTTSFDDRLFDELLQRFNRMIDNLDLARQPPTSKW